VRGLQASAVQRVALQLRPRRAAQDDFKKRTISRAEGGQLQARVRLHVIHTLYTVEKTTF
jgi:hypothetical protein